MATGKHYRGKTTSAQPRKEARSTASTRSKAQADPYNDMYSYEEPRGAKRGTRQPAQRSAAKNTAKKSSIVPTILAVLFLLAAVGILAYMLWDLGVISMLTALLG